MTPAFASTLAGDLRFYPLLLFIEIVLLVLLLKIKTGQQLITGESDVATVSRNSIPSIIRI
jgi:hypothetical protein